MILSRLSISHLTCCVRAAHLWPKYFAVATLNYCTRKCNASSSRSFAPNQPALETLLSVRHLIVRVCCSLPVVLNCLGFWFARGVHRVSGLPATRRLRAHHGAARATLWYFQLFQFLFFSVLLNSLCVSNRQYVQSRHRSVCRLRRFKRIRFR
jgi:hypothetical protein